MRLPLSRRQFIAQLFVCPFAPAFGASGAVSPGATLTIYKTGTMTLAPIYADPALIVSLANPVASDVALKFPAIYLDNSHVYCAVWKDVSGKIVYSVDPINSITIARSVSVKDYGAKGDGTTDDTAAIAAALGASLDVTFPIGRYRISSPLVVRSSQRIRGAGKSPSQPYADSGGGYPAGFLTEILVTNFLAFDMTGTNTSVVSGFAVRAIGGGQSRYGMAANCVAGAMGFLLTGSLNAQISNVSFHGLQFGVAACLTNGQTEASFWKLRDFMAVDCDTVVRTGTATAIVATSRDFMVAECVIADHCNHMIEAHWADGMTLTNLRFFHSFGKSIYLHNCYFITMTAVTLFETAANSLTLDTCSHASMSAMIVSRAGGYTTRTPWPQFTGMTILKSNTVSFDGIIERSSWVAVSIVGSSGVKISGVVDTPFFTVGNLSSTPGAIDIATSTAIELDCSLTGIGYWVAVNSDYASAASIAGTIVADPFCGVVRTYGLVGADRVYVGRVPADMTLASFAATPLGTIRILIPAGKTLVTRSVYLTSPSVVLRSGSILWDSGLTSDAGGETLNTEAKSITTNPTSSPVYFAFTPNLYNPNSASIRVPAGHETHISFGLI